MINEWINTFDDFWLERRNIAKILLSPSDETRTQWYWKANRRENKINIEQCDDPFTGRQLTAKDGVRLLGETLELYKENQWNHKPKVEKTKNGEEIFHQSAVFETFIVDPRSKAERIYVKFAVVKNAVCYNPTIGETYNGTRVQLWSFHPPEK